MAALVNRQPIFTAIPIIKSLSFDPQISDDLTNTVKCTTVYTDASVNGSLISKITVNANGFIGSTVTNKVIYLLISQQNDGDTFNVYKSAYMRGAESINQTVTVPYVEFVFPEGLVLSPGARLAIAATVNSETYTQTGDQVSVIVEGGTYDQPV
jgi:hypothetical protein